MVWIEACQGPGALVAHPPSGVPEEAGATMAQHPGSNPPNSQTAPRASVRRCKHAPEYGLPGWRWALVAHQPPCGQADGIQPWPSTQVATHPAAITIAPFHTHQAAGTGAGKAASMTPQHPWQRFEGASMLRVGPAWVEMGPGCTPAIRCPGRWCSTMAQHPGSNPPAAPPPPHTPTISTHPAAGTGKYLCNHNSHHHWQRCVQVQSMC
jgi:hypothetical protein